MAEDAWKARGACASVWHYDDFTLCFRQRYLEFSLPIILIVLSLCYICVKSTFAIANLVRSGKQAHRYERLGASAYDDLTSADDNDTDTEDYRDAPESEDVLHEIFSKLDERGMMEEIITLPAFYRTVVCLEFVLAALNAGMLTVLAISEYREGPIFVFGLSSFWCYTSMLVLLRLVFRNTTNEPMVSFWNVTATLYGCIFPISAFLLRSALLHGVSKLRLACMLVSSICSFILVSLVLMCRPGNKPSVQISLDGLEPSHEPLASLLSRFYFAWINPLLTQGYSKALRIEDVWDLAYEDRAQVILTAYHSIKLTSSIIRNLSRFLGGMLAWQVLWAVMASVFNFLPAIFLQQVLLYIEDPSRVPISVAWLYTLGMLVGTIMASGCNGLALFIGRRISVKLRCIIIGEVYAKALRRRDVSVKGNESENEINSAEDVKSDSESNNGAIINLMAVDAFKVSEVCAYLHYIIGQVPVEIAIAISLLYMVLGWSAFGGMLALVLLLPLNMYMSRKFSSMQADLMAVTDVRINKMNEILSSIRVIKFFAWEQNFLNDISEVRRKELRHLRRRYVVFCFSALLWFTAPILISVTTFGCYTLIAGQTLKPSVAFTALALNELLRMPLDSLADMITNVLQSKVSLERVDKFLREEETQKYKYLNESRGPNDPQIGFKDASFSWESQNDIDQNPEVLNSSFMLRNLNTEFPVGKYTLIVGPTGSGKTSFLTALLGEMTRVSGRFFMPGSRNVDDLIPDSDGLVNSVAYCAQQAWLLNDTIRNNIVFNGKWDEARYNFVVKACALERDLGILKAGDLTEIGEKGIALSGGQRQRVSLARAMYSNAKHLILDDCLSAVDSHSAEWIFKNCIIGKFMKGRTRIMVSHNVHLALPQADKVIVIENGYISAQGSPEEVMRLGAVAKDDELLQENISMASSRMPSRAPTPEERTDIIEDQEGLDSDAKLAKKDEDKHKAALGKLVLEEERSEGSVNWSVYKSYFKEVGGRWYWVVLVSLYVLGELLGISSQWWLRHWARSTAESASRLGGLYFMPTRGDNSKWTIFRPTSTAGIIGEMSKNQDAIYYLGIYALLLLLSTVSIFARYGVTFYGSLNASKRLHDQLMLKMLRAPMRFFDSTPTGRIMNRFSKDMETIDQDISMNASMFAYDFMNILAVVVIVSVVTPEFLIIAALIVAIYYFIGAYYLRSSRELKRLESVTRSPIYQNFGQSLVGVATIRAYGRELLFVKQNLASIDKNNRPFFYNWVSNRWLSIRIDTIGALFLFSAATLVLLNVKHMDSGLAGISLSSAIQFQENMLWFVRLYAVSEMNMNSVERVEEYMKVESEKDSVIPENRPPLDWPNKGEIEIDNLQLRYAESQPLVIKNLSLHIPAACKVGIVGRTGAGKSTIATAFFRLLEPCGGKIIIDGVDITSIGLEDLRKSLTIIPQDPTLFQKTLRYNLDPFGIFSDNEIFKSLKAVNLVTDFELNSEDPESAVNPNIFRDLDSPISEGGGNISQGQRQLVCLARSLLKRTKVIIMDESTASVDTEIQNRIQNTVLEEYGDSTVLTIAHRLSTIISYDKILVLSDGKVAEYDSPANLLMLKDGIFADMCKVSGEFEMFKTMLLKKKA